ncbi:MAG: hypothetical protein MSS84_03200 [Bacteroidales bacterium]|nr:hypothetical protein [Bacteroidales bacterium]
MKRFDNFWLAAAIGLIVPVAFGLLFFAVFYRGDLSLTDALLLYIERAPSLISKLILVSLAPNLFGVFTCYHTQWWRACRGIMVSVLFYLAAAMFFI